MKWPSSRGNEEEHEVIRALKWIYEHSTFTQKQIQEALGWDDRVWQTNHGEMFRPETDERYSMRYQAVINYLEYIELQESRKTSLRAFKTAIAAIVISAALAFAGIAFSTYQILIPAEVTFQQAQLEEINDSIRSIVR